FDELECLADAIARHRETRAIGELVVPLLARERSFGTTAVLVIGRLNERPAIPQLHLHDAPNPIKPPGLNLRVECGFHQRNHPLDRLARYELIGELADPCLAPKPPATSKNPH